MRKILYFLLAIPALVLAQSTDQNYVKSISYKKPTSAGTVDTNNPSDAVVQVSYFDGLGRPIQQIAHKQSNTGKDIVTHIEYDAFGRQTKEFLPYATWYGSRNLSYTPVAKGETEAYYQSLDPSINGNPAFEATTNPFSEKELESSPLNRVFKQAAPGNAWALGSGKEIKFDYQTNTNADNVKLFSVTATWNATKGLYDIPTAVTATTYANFQLYKTITKDENWTSGKNNTTEEFKDKEGKVVLKRTYNNGGAYDTYYIYDQFGNLTFVLPPLAEGVATATVLNNLGYQYKYDARNRLVEKKLPGKQWEFIVYNNLDQPVATGPALNPWGTGANGWLITKYDALNRVVYTGWYNGRPVSANNRTLYQIEQATITSPYEKVYENYLFDNVTIGYTNKVLPVTNYKVLTINFYDNYSFTGAPNPLPMLIENQTRATNVKGMQTGSWVRVLDNPTSTNAEISYTVYDYKYRPVHTKTTNHLGGYTQVDTHLDWAGKTLYTLTKHKRTNGDTELLVKDMFQYSPQDKLVLHKQQINNLPEQLITKNTYDELGQLISKNVGGTDITGATSLQTVDYSYNIRGWLKAINDVNTIGNDLFAFNINYNDAESATKLYNGNISETFWKTSNDNKLRKYNYSYDHLNRLLQADYSKEGSTTFNSYLEHLTYDKNGNIQSLQRNGEKDTDGYQFENPIDDLVYLYDNNNKNKLLKVFDATANPSGFKDDSDGITDTTNDYTYDANGNMIRDDNKGITNISYNHLNLPTKIFVGSNNIEYLYNATGQKVSKKVIQASEITTTDYLSGFQYKNNMLQFFPHAEGYVNVTQSDLKEVSPIFNYVFNYTDHLGNIRLSYSQDPSTNVLKVIEENHYYPFGLKHSGYNSDQMMYSKEGSTLRIRPVPPLFQTSYKYKYNGKEFQDELSLNWYDYGWRNYDPAISRWVNPDPLINDLDFTFNPNDVDEDDEDQVAFAYETTLGNGGGIYNRNNLNPYTYGYNDPIRFDDPDGRCPNCFTAIAGGLIGGGIELGGQLLSGKSLSEVDWVDVGVETVKGTLIGSGVGAGSVTLIEGTSVVAKASFDYSGKDGAKNVVNGKKSGKEVAFDGVADVVGGKAGGALGKKAGNFTQKNVKAATKAETKATKEVAKATNKFNKATDGGRNMSGSKSMVAKNNLEKAKGGAQVARTNTVKSQMINSATKGAPGQVVNKASQNTVIDKIKNFFGF